MAFTPDDKKRIQDALVARNQPGPCACGSLNRTIADGFISLLGETSPIAIVIACNNCGHLQFFNPGPLGLSDLKK